MRRGPELGVDAGGRAALIGGCDYSSNVEASAAVGLDPKGTHAHSMVQVYMARGEGELEAFRRFAAVYPDDCTLLVDTVDVLDSGVPNAIRVFEELKEAGHRPRGIRIDSGDLAHLAIRAAALLDEAGFETVSIVLSSDLDEIAIWQILAQIREEAPTYGLEPQRLSDRLVFGVGTRLITSHGDAALGGVYKLVGVENRAGEWTPAIKLSEDIAKIPTPGDKLIHRVYDQRGLATADVIGIASEDPFITDTIELYHPFLELQRHIERSSIAEVEPLLVEVFTQGKSTIGRESLNDIRSRREADLDRLDPGVRRLVNPHIYHVSLTRRMKELQRTLVASAAGPSATPH